MLQLAGTGVALALTGQAAANDETGAGDEYTVALSVGVDRDEFAELQEEIVERVEEAEIDEPEAQEQLEESQLELVEAAIEAVESQIEETDDVTVVDAAPERSLVLVDGTPAALLEALEIEEVVGIVPEDQFDEGDGAS
ncbi:hypothetical protein CYV19_08755 [Natronobacterium gregoryi SP2]|uniref:Uncharacterized protein n=1 Tax=Natronobacterium gregoryi (strain ATCC 43098 / DSM 3393 / CCM 3738 / CIP 104747 / IAM 13177 / JCM 8860 / NBRC 102187 / NCIMB 2189 / SP2) TaxID=797304 RepID=L9Y5R3_NATGS|nr:hypothetical protein C490_10170 [Natronobacterium gregoryi SP2]PLK20526.1 hypothetical protein CYV19_08755 [Natronobacterium gregoryi SP2]